MVCVNCRDFMILPRLQNKRSVSSVDIALVGLESRIVITIPRKTLPPSRNLERLFSGAVVGSAKGLKFFNDEGYMAKGEPF